jgi:hypothetical protein
MFQLEIKTVVALFMAFAARTHNLVGKTVFRRGNRYPKNPLASGLPKIYRLVLHFGGRFQEKLVDKGILFLAEPQVLCGCFT